MEGKRKMTYGEIERMPAINDIDGEKVARIADSMRKNGFVGCPILVYNDQLLTGSHRQAALSMLAEEDADVYDWDVAEDVTDIVEDAFARFEEENGYTPDMDFSNIGWMLKGSWVEEYKDEIDEW